MGSSVSLCLQRGVYINDFAPPGTAHPVSYINQWTTPEEFVAVWSSKHPSYGLRHSGSLGNTALHQAAKTGNIPMIEYIARDRIGAKQLLNLGNRNWHTSLFLAIQYNQRSAARTLMRFGAEVNMECLDYRLSSPAPDFLPQIIYTDLTYRTPLSLAIEGNTFLSIEVKTQKVAMAKLILIYKGIAEPKPKTEEGIQILEQAQKEVTEIERTLFKELLESTPATTETIKTIISYVPLDDLPDNVPEIPVSSVEWTVNNSAFISYTSQWMSRIR